MAEINLLIDRSRRDEELEKKIPLLKPVIRIKCGFLFEGTEIPRIAIVDTGAHTSVIPFRFWRNMNVEILAKHYTAGIVPGKKIPVNVGYIIGKLVDSEGNESKEIQFLSYLSFTNKITLLLGMRDLLEKFDLHLKFSENKAWLKEYNNL
ncbi:MAG: hypothetical protein A7315_01440 [Candidatus Altiarchaeales archaeon WOR_SM1_79]|nr:MAG: hypothetical protein A7315_01440 [Candidatus Altiarchaeales archaeon WOR_SM1_79]